MVFGAEVARGKPHPDIFCKACDKLHAAPEDCLVLEDSEAGIQSAFSAHIPVICIPDMRQPGTAFQDMAQAVLPILTDVIDYLERRRSSHPALPPEQKRPPRPCLRASFFVCV